MERVRQLEERQVMAQIKQQVVENAQDESFLRKNARGRQDRMLERFEEYQRKWANELERAQAVRSYVKDIDEDPTAIFLNSSQVKKAVRAAKWQRPEACVTILDRVDHSPAQQ